MSAISRRQFTTGLIAGGLSAQWGPAFSYPDRAQIESLKDVLNVQHLDRAARAAMTPEAYHFVAGAADDGLTRDANRAAWERVRIRPRRLVDVSEITTDVELLGDRYESPVILAPAGNQLKVHADGEMATARAAAAEGHLLIAAQMADTRISEMAAAGGPLWFQLYPTKQREFMLWLAEQASNAGCRALVLTIDGPTRGNHEAERWFTMHRDKSVPRSRARLANFEGYDGRAGVGDPTFSWDDVQWLTEQVALPLFLKGIVTHEDARLCRRAGVAGLIVSNHGGRQEGNGRGTAEVLPEIVAAVDGRMPVLLDGGIRRGADVFKALAMGADAVCIGRPYLWGLGAFGEAGVSKCLQILQSELERTMRYAGTPALGDISPVHIQRP
ncbi:MAG: alpha-hydroxy-acid oxidizing protein [Gammaproteobacteria bacterium]|nr:alpha-hydroxy-acid oxidizing protein [Gammaproteobacteria bacterium]